MQHRDPSAPVGVAPLTRAQQALVLCLPARAMVWRLARRFASGRSPEQAEDFEMAGTSGLIQAAALFDLSRPLTRPTLEETFAAYARAYAVREMSRLCHQEQDASSHMQDYVARLKRGGLDADDPAITEEDAALAARLGMRPDSVSRQRRAIASGRTRPQSLHPDPSHHEPECREDPAPSAEEQAMDAIRDADVRNAVAALPHDLHLAVHLRMEGHTRGEIAGRLSTTENHVKFLLAAGYARLRESLAAYAPERCRLERSEAHGGLKGAQSPCGPDTSERF